MNINEMYNLAKDLSDVLQDNIVTEQLRVFHDYLIIKKSEQELKYATSLVRKISRCYIDNKLYFLMVLIIVRCMTAPYKPFALVWIRHYVCKIQKLGDKLCQ